MMGHNHSHGRVNNILLAFSLNAGFAVLEFFGGLLTNSVAIMSGALHDFGDSLALLFSYYADKLSHRAPDKRYSFGYKRFSLVSALLNGSILLFGSVFVIKEAIERIGSPEIVKPQGMLLLALLGIAVNSFAAYRLSKDEGLNAKMLTYHLLEDLLGWGAVLIVSIVLFFRPWYFLDSILSILISLIILIGVYKNLLKVGKIFLQQFPEAIEREELVCKIKKLQGIRDVHLLQGWSLDESTLNLTLHIVVPEDMMMIEADKLRREIENILREQKISLSTIQMESEDHPLKVN
jgi:cobalt-zinc-cadmium efflux system protein